MVDSETKQSSLGLSVCDQFRVGLVQEERSKNKHNNKKETQFTHT